MHEVQIWRDALAILSVAMATAAAAIYVIQ